MVRARRLLAIALTTSLLWAGSAVTLGGEAAAGPTVVVEATDDPDVRASVRFPAGWRLEAPRGELAPRFINALAIDERCEFSTRRSESPDLATDVDDFVVSLAPGSGFILIAREAVELPAGAAERVDFTSNEDGGRWSGYFVWGGGYVHELWCRGDELPADRWRPIAETFDAEPDEALQSSPFEPVVSRPDAGVAMSFPEAWHVRGSSTNLGLLYATRDTAVCALSDYGALADTSGWATVDDMHDEYVSIADDRDNLVVNEAGYLDLSGGRTGFADISFDDGTRAIRYSFGDGHGRLVALFCVGDPVPDDRYRSLAESLEWLPAD